METCPMETNMCCFVHTHIYMMHTYTCQASKSYPASLFPLSLSPSGFSSTYLFKLRAWNNLREKTLIKIITHTHTHIHTTHIQIYKYTCTYFIHHTYSLLPIYVCTVVIHILYAARLVQYSPRETQTLNSKYQTLHEIPNSSSASPHPNSHSPCPMLVYIHIMYVCVCEKVYLFVDLCALTWLDLTWM